MSDLFLHTDIVSSLYHFQKSSTYFHVTCSELLILEMLPVKFLILVDLC